MRLNMGLAAYYLLLLLCDLFVHQKFVSCMIVYEAAGETELKYERKIKLNKLSLLVLTIYINIILETCPQIELQE